MVSTFKAHHLVRPNMTSSRPKKKIGRVYSLQLSYMILPSDRSPKIGRFQAAFASQGRELRDSYAATGNAVPRANDISPIEGPRTDFVLLAQARAGSLWPGRCCEKEFTSALTKMTCSCTVHTYPSRINVIYYMSGHIHQPLTSERYMSGIGL